MDFKDNVRTVCSRVQTILRLYRRKEKRSLVISAPFNFRHETALLPGITEQEMTILREQAAESCVGLIEAIPRTPSLWSQPEFMALGFSPSCDSLTSDQSIV